MHSNKLHHWERSIVAVAILMSAACVDNAGLGPDLRHETQPQYGTSSEVALVAGHPLGWESASAMRLPDLGACSNLQVPGSSRIAFRVYATGVQIYNWTGTSWSFVGPEALLFADEGGHGQVGTHYGGPTWESANGGKVYGSILERCTPDPTSIPWLLLEAFPDGRGIFRRVSHIQRMNTTGGVAPSHGGTIPGEVARIPYTAVYIFYRAR